MSAANPPARRTMGRPSGGTWGPIALAGAVVVVVLLAVVGIRLFGRDKPSTATTALAALMSSLQNSDINGLQSASCDGWPSASADVAALGTIDTVFLIDGPTVTGGSGSATIGVGDDTPRTSPSPTTSAEALLATADYEVTVGLSYVDDRWCVASFVPKPAA